MTIDLTPIFQAIIALLAALVTYRLIPWLKSKTTEQQQHNIAALAKVAVYAAEQIYGAGQGDKKFEYARQVLLSAGFDVDLDILKAEIENAVHNMPDNMFVLGHIGPLAQDTDETNDDEDEDEDPIGKPEEDRPADIRVMQPSIPEDDAETMRKDDTQEGIAPGVTDPPPDDGGEDEPQAE